MNKLFFEHYEQSELNLILRDLASKENLDVKKLFNDYKDNLKNKKKINHSSSKQVIINKNIARLDLVITPFWVVWSAVYFSHGWI